VFVQLIASFPHTDGVVAHSSMSENQYNKYKVDVMCLMSELCKDVSGKCTHLDNCSSLLSGIDRLSRTCCREFRTLWRAI